MSPSIKKVPPGPKPAFIFGNLKEFSKDPIIYLTKNARKPLPFRWRSKRAFNEVFFVARCTA